MMLMMKKAGILGAVGMVAQILVMTGGIGGGSGGEPPAITVYGSCLLLGVGTC